MRGRERSDRARPLWHLRHRVGASGDAGAGSVEYVGVMAFVGLVVISLLMLVSPIGDTVAARLCAAFGATCGDLSSISATAHKAAPAEPCTLQTDGRHLDYGVEISFVKVGESGDMVTEKMSDGTYRVTVSGELGVQASLSAGEARASLQVGEYGGGLDLKAEVAAGVFAGAGAEYRFSSEADAAAFTDWVSRSVATTGASTVADSVRPGLGVGVHVAGWIWDRLTGYSYTPPAPDATFYEAGPSASADARADVITAGASASIDGEAALGFRVDSATGDKTVYSRMVMDGSAAAQLGLSATDGSWGTGGEGSASVEMVVATTFDADGDLSAVALDTAATAEGAGALSQLAGYELQGGGGKGVTLSASFPVSDSNRTAVRDALAGLGVPGTASGATPSNRLRAIPDAVRGFFQQARSGGDISAQFVDVNSSNLVSAALALEAPVVKGLGVELGLTRSGSTSTGAYFLGDSGWESWDACAS